MRVTFTSASSVRGYVDAVGEELSAQGARGHDRSADVRSDARRGNRSARRSEESTIDGLVDAIERALDRESTTSFALRRGHPSSRFVRRASSSPRSPRGVIACEIVTFKTTGDKKLDEPLSEIGAKGLFTHELEVALARRKSIAAFIRSRIFRLSCPTGLEIVAQLEREDPRDVLVVNRVTAGGQSGIGSGGIARWHVESTSSCAASCAAT